MKLAPRILLLLLAVTTGVMAMYATLESRREREILTAEAQSQHRLLLANAIPGVVNGLWELTPETIEAVVSPLFESPSLDKFQVFDKKGRRYFAMKAGKTQFSGDTTVTAEEASLTTEKPQGEFNANTLQTIRQVALASETNHRLTADLWRAKEGTDPEFIGHIIFDFNTNEVDQRITQKRNRLIAWSIGLALVILGLTFIFIQRAVVSPIASLTRASNRVAQGDFNPIQGPRRKDELGTLTENFNQMVSRIREGMDDLRILGEEGRRITGCSSFLELLAQVHASLSSVLQTKDSQVFLPARFLSRSEGFLVLDAEKTGFEGALLPQEGPERLVIPVMGFEHHGKDPIMHFVVPRPATETAQKRVLSLAEALGVSVAEAVENIQHLVSEKEQQKLQAELEAAKVVQESLLPPPGKIPGVEIAAQYRPAAQTGGDWFGHYFDVLTNRACFYVGDITGHGFPAALLTGVVCGSVYSSEHTLVSLGNGTNPSSLDPRTRLETVAHVVNRVVMQTGRQRHLMTMFMASLDVNTGHLIYLNAAHNPPILVNSQGGDTRLLMGTGNRLGFSDEPEFGVHETQLHPGDRILLFTDGLIENQGPDARMLPLKKVRQLLSPQGTLAEGLQKLLDEGDRIWKDVPPADDVTLLLLEWTGAPQ